MSVVGDNIRRLRESHGMTQEDLHRLTKMNVSHISQLENGIRNPGKKSIKALCDVFCVDEQTLLFGDRDSGGMDRRHSYQVRRVVEELMQLPESEQHKWLARILAEKEARTPVDK